MNNNQEKQNPRKKPWTKYLEEKIKNWAEVQIAIRIMEAENRYNTEIERLESKIKAANVMIALMLVIAVGTVISTAL